MHPHVTRPSARHLSDDLVPRLPSPAAAVQMPAVEVEPEELVTDKLVEEEGQLGRTMQLARALAELAGQGRCNPAKLVLVPAEELQQWRRLIEALQRHEFNKRAAASQLGVDRSTIYRKLRKMKKYGLDPTPGAKQQGS